MQSQQDSLHDLLLLIHAIISIENQESECDTFRLGSVLLDQIRPPQTRIHVNLPLNLLTVCVCVRVHVCVCLVLRDSQERQKPKPHQICVVLTPSDTEVG